MSTCGAGAKNSANVGGAAGFTGNPTRLSECGNHSRCGRTAFPFSATLKGAAFVRTRIKYAWHACRRCAWDRNEAGSADGSHASQCGLGASGVSGSSSNSTGEKRLFQTHTLSTGDPPKTASNAAGSGCTST